VATSHCVRGSLLPANEPDGLLFFQYYYALLTLLVATTNCSLAAYQLSWLLRSTQLASLVYIGFVLPCVNHGSENRSWLRPRPLT
jgi:hypothetical protein